MNETLEADNLKWSVCRVFNKKLYYAVRRHLDVTEEKPRFTELKQEDIHQMIWDVCWPLNQPDDDFVVLKVDSIQMTPETQAPELLLETKVLKTRETRHIQADLRIRNLKTTGTLAWLLGNTLKIADVMVICKNHLVPTADFDPLQWSDVKQAADLFNFQKRPHTMIFIYRHDGQFNYSWSREIEEKIEERNWKLKVGMTQGLKHGACVLIQPEEEFAATVNKGRAVKAATVPGQSLAPQDVVSVAAEELRK